MASALERVEHGSDSIILLCRSCFLQKKQLQPTGYCVNCMEYMCDVCVGHHRGVVLTRNHTILQGSDMPLDMSMPSGQDMCSELCPKHRGKIFEHFCEDDGAFCCSVCVIKDHRSCQNIVYIPEEAEKLLDGDEFIEYMNSLRNIVTQVQSSKDETARNQDTIGRLKSRALNKIKIVREKLNTVLDKLESEMRDKVQELEQRNTDKINKLSAQLQKIDEDLVVLNSNIDKLQKNLETCQLYVTMKRTKAKLMTMQSDCTTMSESNKVTRYYLEPDKILWELANAAKLFGKLVVTDYPTRVRATSMADLNVKSPNETKNWITSMVKMPNNKLVVTDNTNRCLKLIDLASNTIESTLVLPAEPWCITSVEAYLFAVTVPERSQIQIVSFNDNFSVQRTINVTGKCYGIAYSDGKFIVTFIDKPRVQIFDFSGKVIKTITSDDSAGIKFDCPRHVVLSPDKEFMYISDIHTKLVTILSTDGNLWSVGKKSLPNRPAGMHFDEDENLFMCGNWSDNVFCLTPDCTESQQIIGTNDISFPESVLYCEQEKTLYVGMWENDVIKVFQLQKSN